MSECSKHKTWLPQEYTYHKGNFQLHVSRQAVDDAAETWGWAIWKTQPFNQIKTSDEAGIVWGKMSLAKARRTGLLELDKIIKGELVECECCAGRGQVLKHAAKKA